MSTSIVPARPFAFEGHEVRVIRIDDDPWFVASDAAKILGYESSYYLTRGLDDDEKGTHIVGTPGGNQEMTIISESGLYSAILRSRVEGAKEFKRWVTRDVLPQIRKTGSYGQPVAELSGPELMARALIEAQATLTAKDEQIKVLEPKANAWERFCSSSGDMSASEAAKALTRAGLSVGGLHKLYAICDAKKEDGGLAWFFRNGHGQREAYQRVVDQGLIRMKSGSYENSKTGEQVATITPRFTPKALDALAKHLKDAA